VKLRKRRVTTKTDKVSRKTHSKCDKTIPIPIPLQKSREKLKRDRPFAQALVRYRMGEARQEEASSWDRELHVVVEDSGGNMDEREPEWG